MDPQNTPNPNSQPQPQTVQQQILQNRGNPPQQPPASTPTPPVPPTEQTASPIENKPKKRNKKMIFIAAGIVVAVLVLFGVLTIVSKTNLKNITNNDDNKSGGGLTLSKTDKYYKDSDEDSIPDFVETEIGSDPTKSDYDSCKSSKCDGPEYVNSEKNKRNVLIILDSSGSMGLKIGSQTRMDIAKNSIKQYVESAYKTNNIGLMVYGHKGSNSTADKPASCQSAEVLAEIGSLTPNTVDSYLAQVKSVGWTPTGLAISNAAAAFNGLAGENEVILVSDGIETCGTNPAAAAKSLNGSNIAATVNVIAFAVDSAAESELRSVCEAGSGLFSIANDGTDLTRIMNDRAENAKIHRDYYKCVEAAGEAFYSCFKEISQKAIDYLSSLKPDTTEEISAKYDAINTILEMRKTASNDKYLEFQEAVTGDVEDIYGGNPVSKDTANDTPSEPADPSSPFGKY